MNPRIPVRFWALRKPPRRLRWNALALEWGLQEFYQAQPGSTFLRSWNETESLVANPFLGWTGLSLDAGGGYPYGSGTVKYLVLPFRDATERVYAGLVFETATLAPEEDCRVEWLTWSQQPAWVTGYTLIRLLNGAVAGHRHVTTPQMGAGWFDEGNEWIAGLPFGYANPPRVAKVLWGVSSWLGAPTALTTVTSPLGGYAVVLGTGCRLARFLVDALRRNRNGTLAAWVRLEPSSGVLLTLRGNIEKSFHADYSLGTQTLNLANSAITVTDMEAGDWCLLVLRNDAALNRLRINLARLRDNRRFSAAVSLIYEPLTGGSDYFQEGLLSVLGVGGSYRSPGSEAGAWDRIGVWNRALADSDVELLYNNGAGWSPV